jgi:hypothetical protein
VAYFVTMIEHPILRAVFELRLANETDWYRDTSRVASLVEAVSEAPWGTSLTHAGRYGAARRLKKGGTLAAALAKGKEGQFQALDGDDEQTATVSVSFGFTDAGLDVTVMVGKEAYRDRARTLLDEIERLGLGLFARMRSLGAGLSLGFAHPMARGIYHYPQVRPPVAHRRLETAAILELFDLQFHRTTHEDALRDEIEALATAALPPGVTRHERDDLVVVRWIDHLEDDLAVARSAGAHERWMATLAHVKRSDAYDPQGDKRVPIRKSERAPFTFFDAGKGAAYQAIEVDPSGVPDETAWAELAGLAAAPPSDIKSVWLIVPARELALELHDRARRAGFAGVLYPARDHLWDPRPPGWWLDDETSGPPFYTTVSAT